MGVRVGGWVGGGRGVSVNVGDGHTSCGRR